MRDLERIYCKVEVPPSRLLMNNYLKKPLLHIYTFPSAKRIVPFTPEYNRLLSELNSYLTSSDKDSNERIFQCLHL